MKDKRCFTCKYQGKISLDTYYNEIFDREKRHTILLCYAHTIELFKCGQTKYIQKYKPTFTHFYGFEEDRSTMNFFNFR